jgi:hypothetical protein
MVSLILPEVIQTHVEMTSIENMWRSDFVSTENAECLRECGVGGGGAWRLSMIQY